MKANIVLITDFSNTWSAVASMKGVMKIVDNDLQIYDGTNDIDKFDVWQASLTLEQLINFWPTGTVFVCVVDPTVGSNRKASVALLKNGSYVVSPDNGTYSNIIDQIQLIREIDTNRFRYENSESVEVFHGRDIFGYTAAKIASKQARFDEIGYLYELDDIVMHEYSFKKTIFYENYIESFIRDVNKHYGCVMLGIKNDEFNNFFKEGTFLDVKMESGDNKLYSNKVYFGKCFSDVKELEPIIYNGSSEYVCIDLNCGDFAKTYGIKLDKSIKVFIKKPT